MDVLRLTTDDYVLTVRADKVDISYRKASFRNFGISDSTEYSFSGGKINNFELAEAIEGNLKLNLSVAALNTSVHPVFFENKEYIFDVVFNEKTESEPAVYSSLQEIKKSFILREVKGSYFLTGAINYKNDIGKADFVLHYQKNGHSYNHKLSFEVFPVKLDYKTDYKCIIADINKEFSSLVFDVLKKTYTGFKEGSEINNDIVWWGVFGQLYKEILSSANLILNNPHNRLVRDNYYSKADRIMILDHELEEQVSEHRKNTQKYYCVERKTLTVNTMENQFFKYSVFYVLEKFIFVKNKLLSFPDIKITEEFRSDLEMIEKEFSVVIHNPLFKKIDNFRGFRQESLVLQKAIGYSSLFRDWIILKKGIDFLEGVNRIELKNIADLYQIWCFIEMKNTIQTILNKKPEEVNLAEILVDGFTIELRSGKHSRVSFRKDNGDFVELFHELKFTNKITNSNVSHTVNQEPDIVLRITKNDLKENYKFTYLFDAKYRLISDDNEDSQDYPPDDAINQMHRYRDAIFYQENRESEKPKKEVIGAFVLFPGADFSEDVEKLYFQKSIRQVNIGAYPLIPGYKKFNNNSLLTAFLKETLETKDSTVILKEDVLVHKGLKYEDPNALILAGFVSEKIQRDYFLSGKAGLYHMPVYLKQSGRLNTIRNIEKLKYFCPIIDGITEYYEISEIRVASRSDVFENPHPLYSDSEETYYVFSLTSRITLPRIIETATGGNRIFRYARFSELRNSTTINDFNKTIQEKEY
jgi:hypothetical protein